MSTDATIQNDGNAQPFDTVLRMSKWIVAYLDLMTSEENSKKEGTAARSSINRATLLSRIQKSGIEARQYA
jgi:hypothetical protein